MGRGNILKSYKTFWLGGNEEDNGSDETQRQINQIMSSIGTYTPEQKQEFDKAEQDYINQSKEKFFKEYNPSVSQLREDTAQRFGNLDNSQFLDGLNKLEENKQTALSNIINNAGSYKQGLMDYQDSEKLKQAETLGGILSDQQKSLVNRNKSQPKIIDYLGNFMNSDAVKAITQVKLGASLKRQDPVSSYSASQSNTTAKTGSQTIMTLLKVMGLMG
jgi:hypothetical protein